MFSSLKKFSFALGLTLIMAEQAFAMIPAPPSVNTTTRVRSFRFEGDPLFGASSLIAKVGYAGITIETFTLNPNLPNSPNPSYSELYEFNFANRIFSDPEMREEDRRDVFQAAHMYCRSKGFDSSPYMTIQERQSRTVEQTQSFLPHQDRTFRVTNKSYFFIYDITCIKEKTSTTNNAKATTRTSKEGENLGERSSGDTTSPSGNVSGAH